MEILGPADFKKYFYASLILALICLFGALLAIGSSASGNSLVSSVIGMGDVQIRHDFEDIADYASAKNSTISYSVGILWGVASAQTIDSNYHISARYADRKNAYRITGNGADHSIKYTAEKISGEADFANKITYDITESGNEQFDSVIKFDTRDGNATISGRIYNSVEGRPATLEEANLVGQFLIEEHLNVSRPAITPDNWLGFCDSINSDMILDKNIPDGIYLLPENTSMYDYILAGNKIVRKPKEIVS